MSGLVRLVAEDGSKSIMSSTQGRAKPASYKSGVIVTKLAPGE